MREIYLLNSDKFENIKNLPVIKINFFKKEIDLDPYNGIIFTSKNSVRAIDLIGQKWREKEIYSIGAGTSKEIKRYNVNPIYTAKNSYGDSFAQEIKEKLKGKRILFLRAKKVTSKLNHILKNSGVNLDEIVIYETICKEYKNEEKPIKNSVIIFTSPSTVKCFLKNFIWDKSYRAVAIGKVTAKEIPQNIKVFYSKEQTIQSCIDKANVIKMTI